MNILMNILIHEWRARLPRINKNILRLIILFYFLSAVKLSINYYIFDFAIKNVQDILVDDLIVVQLNNYEMQLHI